MILLRDEKICSLAAVLCSGIAAGFDLRSRRIPNLLTGPGFLIALVLHGVIASWNGVGEALLGAAAGFALTLPFFLMGGMGAGDVKLIAVVGCFLGLEPLGPAMLATALYGAGFALVVAQQRGRLRELAVNALELLEHHRTEGLIPHPEINLQSQNGLRIPYAVPIALGCLTVLALQVGRE